MSNQALTPKQQRFVEEYLCDLNATQAAIRAGYSAKTAAAAGRRNLANPQIWGQIQAGMDERSQRTEINQDRVLKEEACIAFSDIGGIFQGDTLLPPDQLPEDIRRSVSAIEVIETPDKDGNITTKYKYRFWDKGKALERVSRHLGMYTDNAKPNGGAPNLGQAKTLDDCKQILSELMNRVANNQMNSQTAGKLVQVVSALATCIRDGDLETRIQELEKQLSSQ